MKYQTNNISVHTIGRLQITTRYRAAVRMWDIKRVGEGSLRVDTGFRTTYFKVKPRKFSAKRMVTNVPR